MSQLSLLGLGLVALLFVITVPASGIMVVAGTTIPSDLIPLAYINGVVVELAYLDPSSGMSIRDAYQLAHRVYDSLNLPRGFELGYVRVYVISDRFYIKFMGRDPAGRLIACYAKVLLSSGDITYSIYEVGLGVDDPLVVNAVFKTTSSTFTRWVIEAVVKSYVALGLSNVNFTWFSLGFAEIINPEDKLLAAIYFVDNREYGVIYDWGRHVVVRTGQDLIAIPVNAPGLQKHVPTTTIAIVTTPTVTPAIVSITTPRIQSTTTRIENTNTTSIIEGLRCRECIKANISQTTLVSKAYPSTTRETSLRSTPTMPTSTPITTKTITQTSISTTSTINLSYKGEATTMAVGFEGAKIVVVLASSLIAGIIALIVIKRILA